MSIHVLEIFVLETLIVLWKTVPPFADAHLVLLGMLEQSVVTSLLRHRLPDVEAMMNVHRVRLALIPDAKIHAIVDQMLNVEL